MLDRQRYFHGQTEQWCKIIEKRKKKDSNNIVVKNKKIKKETPTHSVGVSISNKSITEDGRVVWGGYNADNHYEWEEELVEVIQNNEENILTAVREKGLIKKYGNSEKTWKNRITEMKQKYGIEKRIQQGGKKQ